MSVNVLGKRGDLAYLDAFRTGLIPCKVMAVRPLVREDGRRETIVDVKVTAARGAYERGEILHANPRYVWPRRSTFTRDGFTRVRNNYVWVEDEEWT